MKSGRREIRVATPSAQTHKQKDKLRKNPHTRKGNEGERRECGSSNPLMTITVYSEEYFSELSYSSFGFMELITNGFKLETAEQARG